MVAVRERYDARILLKLPCELAYVYVNGVDARGTALEQAIGEASVGGADVEADLIRGVDGKVLESAFEFLSGATRKFRVATGNRNLGRFRDRRAWFVDASTVN